MIAFDKQLFSARECLNKSYSKEILQHELLPKVKTFIVERSDLLQKEKVPPALLQAITNFKNGTKDDIAALVAVAFATEPIYHAFLQQLPEVVRTVWTILIFKGTAAHNWIEDNYKIYLTEQVNHIKRRYIGYQEVELKPEFRLFRSGNSPYRSWGDPIIKLTFPPELRALLITYHDIPESAKLVGVENPDNADNIFGDSELLIHSELPRIITYWQSQQFSYTAKLRPSITALGKANKNLHLREFFPEGERVSKLLRTQLIAGIFAWVGHRQEFVDVPSFLKSIVQQTYLHHAVTAPWLLPDLHGLAQIENISINRVEPQMFKVLGALPSGQWVTWKNIQSYLYYNAFDIRPISTFFAENKVHYKEMDPEEGYLSERMITLDIYEEAITYPIVKGSFFLFAALGLCEIAYDDVGEADTNVGIYSCWDGLMYVKRTGLGDYVCGLTDTYQLDTESQSSKLEFSKDTLFISTKHDDVSTQTLIAPYTEQIGPGRFHTNAAIFLKGIRSKKELEGRIMLFRNVVGQELPDNWVAFLRDLTNNINPLNVVSLVTVYNIPPHNQTLINLFARDEELRSLVSKAENFQIIVPNTNLVALKKRLHALGYFIQ